LRASPAFIIIGAVTDSMNTTSATPPSSEQLCSSASDYWAGSCTHSRSVLFAGPFGADLVAGVVLGLVTVALTVLLEALSWRTALTMARKDPQLYNHAWRMNILNNLCLGPIIFAASAWVFARPQLPPTQLVFSCLGVLAVHAVGYYLVHKAFHEVPGMYCHHKLHHKFNTFVPPSAANCVSVVEYVLAYMAPFPFGAIFFSPDRLAVLAAASVVSFCNLLIHTPPLAEISARWLPWWAVATSDHLEHHRRLTCLYAAPTISLDRLLGAERGTKRGPD